MSTGTFILVLTNTWLIFCLVGARTYTRALERQRDDLEKRLRIALEGFSK